MSEEVGFILKGTVDPTAYAGCRVELHAQVGADIEEVYRAIQGWVTQQKLSALLLQARPGMERTIAIAEAMVSAPGEDELLVAQAVAEVNDYERRTFGG